ncbi:hypothetical protein PM082_009843 [Marasmius tenuissimus]|nr:hypothetical protein PM082_009843 [Marasmius tenuissimus]
MSDLAPRHSLTEIFRLVVIHPVLMNSINLFLYATYIYLFRRVLSILKSRNSSADLRFHKITLVSLFVLASVSVPLCIVDDLISVAEILWQYEGKQFPARLLNMIDVFDICRYCIILVMGIAGDSIMIFRCYVLWGYRKRYVAGPLIGLILVDLTAITTIIIHKKFDFEILRVVSCGGLIANGVLNFILASMIAGRLIWISRKQRDWLEEPTARRFGAIVSILLGSGFLLAIVMIIYVVGNLLPNEHWFDAGAVLMQIMGIAPTLVVFRANAYRDDSEVGVNSCALDESTTGDLESRPESADLQIRSGS